MNEQTASLLVQILGLYTALGLLFALVFVSAGAQRIDPDAKGASWGFKLVVLPGVTALWPLLAWRWARGSNRPAIERNAHRSAARSERS